MLFKKKAMSLALAMALAGTSVAGLNAAERDSIIGSNRYETAAKVADRMGRYNTAILVNSDNSLADGLSASSLAGKEKAPILLVKKDSIPKETLKRLKNVKKVYIIGGKAAISGKVEAELSGKTVRRIEGKDRVDTSKKVADMVGNYKEAFIVNGFKGEADAMSAASVAARDKAPILLTKGTKSDHEFKSGVKYYVVGGTSVVSDSVTGKYSATRLAGSNRYETNRVLVNKFYPDSKKLYYTKGDLLVDALTVSSLAKNNGVVLVARNSDNSILEGKNVIQVGGMDFIVEIGKEDTEEKTTGITSYSKSVTMYRNTALTVKDFKVVAYDKNGKRIPWNRIKFVEEPDIYKVGTQKVAICVMDGEEILDQVEAELIVKEYPAPKITSLKKVVTIKKGQNVSVKDFKVEAYDVEAGGVRIPFSKMEFVNPPDTNKVGVQKLDIWAFDSNGYYAQESVTLIVE